MHSLSRSFHKHARLKFRAALGSALSRRRFQATDASAALPSSAASPVAGPSNPKASRPLNLQIPSPLHVTQRDSQLSQHNLYPASSTLEQLALLEVCLATGNIPRARKIFDSIRNLYQKEEAFNASSSEQYDDFDPSSGQWRRRLRFSDVVPTSIHAQFLRAFFRQAIVQDSARTSKTSQLRKHAAVSQAWEWFEMLLNDESTYGQLDDAAWAIMFKGLIATNLSNPNLATVDPAAPHLKPISYLYHLMKEHGRSLHAILQNSIFSHAGLAGLNDHSAVDVCEGLAAVLAEAGETDTLSAVDKVKQDFSGAQFGELAEASYQGPTETAGVSATTGDALASSSLATAQSDPLQPARRSEEEKVPFRLNSLKANLEAITGHRQTAQDPYVRQDLLEESAYDAAVWQSMHQLDSLESIGIGTEVRMKSSLIQENMSRWLEALTARLEETIHDHGDAAKEKEKKPGETETDADILALLSLISVDKLAHITIVETLRIVTQNTGVADGVRAARAVIHLGRAIEDEYGAEAWKSLYPDLYDEAMKRAAETTRKTVAVRQFMQQQGIEAGAAKEARVQGYGDEADDLLKIEDAAERQMKLEARKRALPWTQKMRAKVGGLLIKHLLDVAIVKRTAVKIDGSGETITQKQPAFWQSYQFLRSQKVGIIKLNPVIADRLDKDYVGAIAFPRYLPMLVKPKPWTGWDSGGYRIHPTPVMRARDNPEQEQYVRLAAENGQMKEVFAALDALGSTAWRINRPIYNVISKVWNSGEALGDIPMDNAESKIPDPEKPSVEQLAEPSYREAYRSQIREVRAQRVKAHGQRCTLNYKLEIARAYLDETFYFPHNIDFRGRAYPIPPNLSHIGDDITRGLLEFAEGRPLGGRGLTWLRVHIANTAGFDKASLVDREAFTQGKLAEIMDSADKPLEGDRWWLKADDPWQCLAACIELTNALRSPNPEEFISHIPIQQDGTCNGLQHYAALGGDRTGAEQVNLAVGEKPADVYTAVANLVNTEIAKDLQIWEELKEKTNVDGGLINNTAYTSSETAVDVANQEVERRASVASVLKGKVTRKVVKQTVMTTVYGVTFIGAKRQIQRQLRDRGDIPQQWQYAAANYLAEKVLTCIGDLFQGASSIQLWLSICARLIGRSVLPQPGKSYAELFSKPMASVIWTTPLGLPVAQPYRKIKKSQVQTALQSVFISDPNMPTAIDPRAQATAFPPNYIHSLDASHMMMTAIECKRRGLVYASVHDSYWTHACDVDEMSAALRDCFIKLHSQDLLGDLKAGFQERYAGYVLRRKSVRRKKADAASTTTVSHPPARGNAQMSQALRREAAKLGSAIDGIGQALEKDQVPKIMDLDSIAAEYGMSALPPLAIARDEKLLKELKERESKAGSLEKSDEQLQAEEEKAFAIEEGLEAEEQKTQADAPGETALAEKEGSEESQGKKTKSRRAAETKAPKTRPNAVSAEQPSKPTFTGIQVYDLANAFPEIPPRGDFDLENIRDSPYFFS